MTETLTLNAFEVRFATDEAGTFSGYAAVFAETNSFNESVRAGAFRRSLAEHKRAKTAPAMFFNHDPGLPIGTWSTLDEDARGLKVTGKLITATRAGADAYELLKAGAVTGLSIGFRARGAERSRDGLRILTDIDLVEVSLVSLPAAAGARVSDVRAAPAGLAAFTEAVRRAANILRGNT